MIHVNVHEHHFVINMYYKLSLLDAITTYILDESELFQWTSNFTLEFQ